MKEHDEMKQVDLTVPIGREAFLRARMAYLADLRNDGCSLAEMREAVNIHDDRQAQLLLMTWDERAAR